LAALDDDEFMNKTINLNIIEKEKIETKLDELGIERIPSAANFITTHWDTEIKAKTITQKMLDRGIILRHLVSFGWPEHVRISIGLENENENFLQTLEKII
jgi:Histidinol-phosphate/aromatic aminotransferase and cobyric acid decarboxylase